MKLKIIKGLEASFMEARVNKFIAEHDIISIQFHYNHHSAIAYRAFVTYKDKKK